MRYSAPHCHRTRGRQKLARRTVTRLVEDEVLPRERAVITLGLVDGDVRGDLLHVDDPIEHRCRLVASCRGAASRMTRRVACGKPAKAYAIVPNRSSAVFLWRPSASLLYPPFPICADARRDHAGCLPNLQKDEASTPDRTLAPQNRVSSVPSSVCGLPSNRRPPFSATGSFRHQETPKMRAGGMSTIPTRMTEDPPMPHGTLR